MNSLKTFLDGFYSDYDLIENEHGTFVRFHLGGEITLYFDDDWSAYINDKNFLGAYYDEEEAHMIGVFKGQD